MREAVLLIGYGNTLRGDDGAGPRLAEIVAAWKSPFVRVLIRHALVPELAEDLHNAERVLFADACPGKEHLEVLALSTSKELKPLATLGHVSDPAGLLTLTQTVYGQCPLGQLLLLPAENLAMGQELSATARAGIEAASAWIRAWLSEEFGW